MTTQTSSDTDQKHVQLLKAALNLRQGGENIEALSLLEKAIQLKPDFLLAHIFLGLTYQAVDQLKEAEKSFRAALKIDSQSSEALQGLGLLLLSQNRLVESLGYLTRHLQIDPVDEATLNVLIPALSKAGRLAEAEAILTTAWNKTKNGDIARRYARFLLSIGQVEKAQGFLREALAVSETPHLLVELALILVIEEKYAEAIDLLQKALQLRPDYDRALRGLAHCYTQLNEAEKAIEMAERALAINPNHYRNWQAKSDALLLLKRYDEASEASQTGINLIEPGDEEAQPVLAVLYLQRFNALYQLGMTGEALEIIGHARRQMPDDSRFYLYPAQVLLQMNRAEDALSLVVEAVDKQLLEDPDQREGWLHNIANAAINDYVKGNTEAAKRIFETLVERMPGESRFSTAYAYILIGEGHLELAEEFLRGELEKEHGEQKGILYNDMGYIHLLQSRYDLAEQDFQAALQYENTDAFLRAAFWQAGQLIPDYAAHPSRSSASHMIAYANLAALYLARNSIEQAVTAQQSMQAAAPDDALTFQASGCIAAAQGEWQKAREEWEHALRLSLDEREQKMILDWLSNLSG